MKPLLNLQSVWKPDNSGMNYIPLYCISRMQEPNKVVLDLKFVLQNLLHNLRLRNVVS